MNFSIFNITKNHFRCLVKEIYHQFFTNLNVPVLCYKKRKNYLKYSITVIEQ